MIAGKLPSRCKCEVTETVLACLEAAQVRTRWSPMQRWGNGHKLPSLTVLIRVTIAMIKHYDQKRLGRGGLFGLHFHIHSLSLKEVGTEPQTRQNLNAGADTVTMKGCFLLTCSSWHSQPAFFQNPGPQAHGWLHPQSFKKIVYCLAYSLIL